MKVHILIMKSRMIKERSSVNQIKIDALQSPEQCINRCTPFNDPTSLVYTLLRNYLIPFFQKYFLQNVAQSYRFIVIVLHFLFIKKSLALIPCIYSFFWVMQYFINCGCQSKQITKWSMLYYIGRNTCQVEPLAQKCMMQMKQRILDTCCSLSYARFGPLSMNTDMGRYNKTRKYVK